MRERRKFCEARPREEEWYIVSKIRRAVGMKIAIKKMTRNVPLRWRERG